LRRGPRGQQWFLAAGLGPRAGREPPPRGGCPPPDATWNQAPLPKGRHPLPPPAPTDPPSSPAPSPLPLPPRGPANGGGGDCGHGAHRSAAGPSPRRPPPPHPGADRGGAPPPPPGGGGGEGSISSEDMSPSGKNGWDPREARRSTPTDEYECRPHSAPSVEEHRRRRSNPPGAASCPSSGGGGCPMGPPSPPLNPAGSQGSGNFSSLHTCAQASF